MRASPPRARLQRGAGPSALQALGRQGNRTQEGSGSPAAARRAPSSPPRIGTGVGLPAALGQLLPAPPPESASACKPAASCGGSGGPAVGAAPHRAPWRRHLRPGKSGACLATGGAMPGSALTGGGLPRPERSSPSRSCSGPSSPWSGARPPSFSGSGSSCGKPDRASTSKSPSSCGCSSSTSGGEAVARLRGGLPRPPQPARGLCENPRLALGLRSRRGPALEISASGLRGADRCAASPSTLTRRARQPPRMP